MNRLMMAVGSIGFGYAGSLLAGVFGASDWSPTSLVMGLVGSIIGLFAGWYVAQNWF